MYIYIHTHIYTHTHIVYICYPSPKNASSKKAKILFFHHCKPRVLGECLASRRSPVVSDEWKAGRKKGRKETCILDDTVEPLN